MSADDHVRVPTILAERSPQLKVTKYDVTVSVLATTAAAGILTLTLMIVVFLSSAVPADDSTDTTSEIFRSPEGGVTDRTSDETPRVDSPEDPSRDPSLANDERDVTDLQDVVKEISDESLIVAAAETPTDLPGLRQTITGGSADGTGGLPLGQGDPDDRGELKRERRWFVEFNDSGDLETYAAQLDSLGIEMAAMFASERRLVYMRNMSADSPITRVISQRDADRETRLFMSWLEGSSHRRTADIELFRKANVDASAAEVLHYYSSETEQQMAKIEEEFAGHSPDEIRRTHFRVRRSVGGFEFYVEKQTLR